MYIVPAPLNVDLITNDLQYQESKLEISLQFEVLIYTQALYRVCCNILLHVLISSD